MHNDIDIRYVWMQFKSSVKFENTTGFSIAARVNYPLNGILNLIQVVHRYLYQFKD